MSNLAESLPSGRFSSIRIPALPDGCDGMAAAFKYVAAGLYIGPMQHGDKNPASVLDRGQRRGALDTWPSKTFNDSERVVMWWERGDYGVFLHCGRSGLVVLDIDRPELVPAEWWPILATAPFQATQDQSGRRGHYLFAVPEGRVIGNAVGATGRLGWGEVRGTNGIIVVAPTRHARASEGASYRWVRTGPVPVCPDLIADTLPEGKPGERSLSDADVLSFIAAHADGDPAGRRFLDQPTIRFHQKVEERQSRHNSACAAAAWIAKEAAAGWYGAADALSLLEAAFTGSFTPGERAKGRGDRTEWEGILSWAIGQVTVEDVRIKREMLEAKRGVTYLQHRRTREGDDDKECSPVADEATQDDPQEAPEDRTAFHTGARGKDGRVRIHVGDQAAAAAWMRSEMGRGELAGLFMRGGQLVHTPRIGEDGYIPPKRVEGGPVGGLSDGPAQVRPVSLDGLISMIEVRYDVGTVKETKPKPTEEDEEPGETVRRWNRCLLPKALGVRMIGSALQSEGVPNLQPLQAVTHTPVMRPDGTILDRPGYDQGTGVLYLPRPDARTVAVPESPSAEQVAAAREMVLYPVGQFPFVTDDDLANWVGCALTPLLRPLIPPPYQFGVIEAPSPGSGKGFLLGVLDAAHGVAMRPGMPAKDEEWSKVVMTMLSSTTSPILAFDNVRGVVHSQVLEGLLTSASISDRTLGKNTEAMTLPNDRLWMMTGNNAQIGGDLARRTLRITIDPKMENPEARTGFRCHPVRWTRENREAYIAALLTVARAWVVAGRPVRPVERSDDYATWVQTVRGILEFAGFPGVFANSAARGERSEEDEEWSRFLGAIGDVLGGETFTARELHGAIGTGGLNDYRPMISPDLLPGDLAERFGAFGQESRFMKSIGLWLKNRVGRYSGGLTIVDCGKGTTGARKNVAVYRLGRASDAESLPTQRTPESARV